MFYKGHIFVEFGVGDVRESLTDCEPDDYPKLQAMDDDELDGHLERCARKGYCIWHSDSGGLDLDELENLAS